eukprot:GDKI01037973.1.p1 GENE.GDKI01037973.1~~GDKI01037973.1.p1  ORF type:complete len:145 (-),score=33.55 GDKI01037973.1:70-450(-)
MGGVGLGVSGVSMAGGGGSGVRGVGGRGRTMGFGYQDLNGSCVITFPEQQLVLAVTLNDFLKGPAASREIVEEILHEFGLRPSFYGIDVQQLAGQVADVTREVDGMRAAYAAKNNEKLEMLQKGRA